MAELHEQIVKVEGELATYEKEYARLKAEI
jgi:hypothetical protein